MPKVDTDLTHALESMTTEELQGLGHQLAQALTKAQHDPMRNVNQGDAGSERDPLVKRLAADMLRMMRGPSKSYTHGDLSYEKIGDSYGVSRERVRQLYEQLCPLEYGREKRSA